MEIVFTDRELDVMSVLWRLESATVAEARAELADDLAYTTVLTVLQTLEQKGFVRHEAEGKAYRYHPAVEREAASQSALSRMVQRLFNGSPELVLTQLVSDRDLSEESLERMRALLNDRIEESRS